MKSFKLTDKEFKVVGAGKIKISEDTSILCGKRAGFSFGVEWGKYGFAGGVLSREEAKNLADFINEQLDKCTDTEDEAYSKGMNENKK